MKRLLTTLSKPIPITLTLLICGTVMASAWMLNHHQIEKAVALQTVEQHKRLCGECGTTHTQATLTEPHAPVEVSEAEVSDVEPGAPASAQQADTQREAPMQESAASKAENRDVVRAWVEWHKKADEIYAKELQANQALIDALPSTEAEQARYETDENFKREVGRKVTEAGKKIGEAVRMRQAHEEKRPSPPTQ